MVGSLVIQMDVVSSVVGADVGSSLVAADIGSFVLSADVGFNGLEVNGIEGSAVDYAEL